ncbi:malate synthase G [Aliiglaciecola lipolytica]|uniref:Malate synthase G n=1 Tax=Aliiglaciecola lipolytica E3 TaxID=1127673 RepID=K6XMG2_9ALTE|nr:malate synthase G [Aliiglaciecola lipolytica]GAC12846.1 malate synthase G [Aliiglaciecola lipolytica E3]
MQNYISRGSLQIAEELSRFIEDEAIVGAQVDLDVFWDGFEKVLAEFVPKNKALLLKRDDLQQKIDRYCQHNPHYTLSEYKDFLHSIGYLLPQPAPFNISTQHVDPEIATMAGPQLVVPINNARYAINAANARWGSLYDALYGTDVISEENGARKQGPYNSVRGQKVIEHGRRWLDVAVPLAQGSHQDVVAYQLKNLTLECHFKDGSFTSLQDPNQLVGLIGKQEQPSAIILIHNGLHIELQFDPNHPVGSTDPSGLKDIVLEAALTTIMDCEDSVAAVDAQDKTLVYRNWLGLMKGTLSTSVQKGHRSITRKLNDDKTYTDLHGQACQLKGRSLMFIRNVGLLMSNDAILFNGEAIPEGIMDCVITSLIGKHDLLGNSPFANSNQNSIYIVKPKMHGPEEVAFSNSLFAQVEKLLGLKENTIKMGIMDEERRTSVNLSACIEAAKTRVVFINTGFLDRTGDEIHTSMHLGPFGLKGELKTLPWISAYEKDNVGHGLAAGLSGKAQIGKGMWPIPDHMAEMMTAKIQHPKTGANTAWVPSPTAATLHALHYHQVNVFDIQAALKSQHSNSLDDILTVPIKETDVNFDDETKTRELDNNVQGILGYVVRWVNQGIGCSKVPDINNVGLMEDRATLRISSQHIANWLLHGLVSESEVQASLNRMAKLVDQQNASDPEYISMCPDLDKSIAFEAANALIFDGINQPNGYTEPLLHEMRRKMKQQLAS